MTGAERWLQQLRGRKLGDKAKLAILLAAELDDGSFSVRSFAERLECSMSTARAALAELEAAGLLERVPEYLANGGRIANRFQLRAGALENVPSERSAPSKRREPHKKRFRRWQLAVFERDGWACIDCSANKGLHAHHIEPRSKAPDRALDIANGVSLCKRCHGVVTGDEEAHAARFAAYVEARRG